MDTRVALIAFALLGCVALAAAQAKICDDKATPLQPKDAQLFGQSYDAASKKTVVKVSWRNALVGNPAGGCITGYRIMVSDAATGAVISTDNVQAGSITDPVKAEVKLPPGKKVTLKVVAINGNNGKQSPAETAGTITTASAPTTATPL